MASGTAFEIADVNAVNGFDVSGTGPSATFVSGVNALSWALTGAQTIAVEQSLPGECGEVGVALVAEAEVKLASGVTGAKLSLVSGSNSIVWTLANGDLTVTVGANTATNSAAGTDLTPAAKWWRLRLVARLRTPTLMKVDAYRDGLLIASVEASGSALSWVDFIALAKFEAVAAAVQLRSLGTVIE